MGKARKKPEPAAIIEGPVRHACGWVSDGAPFPEGAGCPKCGEPILEADCEGPEGQVVEDDDDEEDEDDDAAAEAEDEDLEDEEDDADEEEDEEEDE